MHNLQLLSAPLLAFTLCSFVMGCSPPGSIGDIDANQVTCQSQGEVTPFCSFKNPEDIVSIPHSEHLIVSEMGAFMSDEPGSLVLFDTQNKRRIPIDIDWTLGGETWGDPVCKQPDASAFSPHGIDLLKRGDHLSLLVVNHGKRESIEFFQVEKTPAHLQSNQPWRLKWKGCAKPPGDPFINDVSGLRDSGFLVTHMWDKQTPYWLLVTKYLFGADTGWVWRWHPEKGFSLLESTKGSAPNGVAVNHNDDTAFINLYGDDKTIKIDIDSDKKLGELLVQQPDNITLDQSGQLWIASHLHNPVSENCDDVTQGPCMLPFEIVRVDPNSLRIEDRLIKGDMPMGYATVALRVGSKMYLGSAHGDRILEIDFHRSTNH